MTTPKERLQSLARNAILQAKGDTEMSLAALNDLLTGKNSAPLERELCSAYRTLAMRALLAGQFNELRAEGKIAPITAFADNDSDATSSRPRPSSWAREHVMKIEQRKRNYLNDFLVSGEPIGDCTPEVVYKQAARREQDARFMRMMADGVPPEHRIRDFVTEQEADEYWERAKAEPQPAAASVIDNPHVQQLWHWLIKGIKTDDELAQATARAEELSNSPGHLNGGTAAAVEFDGLARVISEYEDARR